MADEHQWRWATILWPRTSITGARVFGLVMRRRTTDGRWQYREMTAQEEEEFQQTFAW